MNSFWKRKLSDVPRRSIDPDTNSDLKSSEVGRLESTNHALVNRNQPKTTSTTKTWNRDVINSVKPGIPGKSVVNGDELISLFAKLAHVCTEEKLGVEVMPITLSDTRQSFVEGIHPTSIATYRNLNCMRSKDYIKNNDRGL